MLSRIFALSVTALVATVGGTARADFDDTFATPNPSVFANTTTGSPFSNTASVQTGLTRTATATVTADTLGTGGSALLGQTTAGPSIFSVNLGSGTSGFANLDYTYSTSQDLSTAGTDFILSFLAADFNVPFSVTITDTASNSATQSDVAVSGGATYTFAVSGFTGVDLASVQSINVSINSGPGSVAAADFTLDRVRIATPTPPNNPIPTPAGLVLFGIGAVGLGLVRKLRGQPVIA